MKVRKGKKGLNRVYFGRDGFIHVIYDGDQSLKKTARTRKEINMLSDALKKCKQKALILVHANLLGKPAMGVERFAKLKEETIHFDRIAVFGASKKIEALASVIAGASAKDLFEERRKLFDSRAKAVVWLDRKNGIAAARRKSSAERWLRINETDQDLERSESKK